MKLTRIINPLFTACLFVSSLTGISIVYNFKFAEITRPQYIVQQDNGAPHYAAAVTFFERFNKTCVGNKYNALGGLGTFLYRKKLRYFRIDGAVARVSQKLIDNSCFGRTQTDDILFTLGQGWKVNNKIAVMASGFLGIPTHKDVGLLNVQFGTGHVGMGAQLDGSFLYSKNKHHAILTAARYIRFLSAHSSIRLGPICQKYNVGLGNLCDVYLAHFSNWGKHRFEIGYNSTSFFGSSFCPPNQALKNAFHFVRSSFVAYYQYGFLLNNHPSTLIFVFSYGFDHGKRLTRSTTICTSAIAFAYTF